MEKRVCASVVFTEQETPDTDTEQHPDADDRYAFKWPYEMQLNETNACMRWTGAKHNDINEKKNVEKIW